MDAHRVTLCEAVHHIDRSIAWQFGDEVADDGAEGGGKARHALWRVVFIVNGAEGGVFRRVHAARHGDVAGGNAAGEDFRVREGESHVFVAEKGVAEVVVVRHRTTCAHGVVGGKLVALDGGRAGVPVVFGFCGHNDVPLCEKMCVLYAPLQAAVIDVIHTG